jgi:hypothetical protein
VSPVDGSVVLWVLAGIGVLWLVAPIVAYHLGRTTIRNALFPEPERALPRRWDRSYARAFRELTALGFQPAGSTIETTWFMTPMNWRKQFPEVRWLVSPDGMTFVACYRLLAFEPVRFAVYSMNDRGGIVETASPGAKVSIDPGGADRRIEAPGLEGAALLARHQAEVASFCEARGWSAVPTTLAQMVDRSTNVDRRIARKVVGLSFSIIPLAVVALPLLTMPTGSGPGSHRVALAILSGVATFAVFRVVAVPLGVIVLAASRLVERLRGHNR